MTRRAFPKLTATTDAFTLVEIMIVVAFIGILAALAIPSLQRINRRAQDTAVINNARLISAALDAYYLENGTNLANLSDLIGNTKYLREFRPIAGEIYPATFVQGQPYAVTNIGGIRTLTFER
jgi:prepilin-type N-terminal cleavage/methylation domain-containing protein